MCFPSPSTIISISFSSNKGLLAEVGSLQLEFGYLSQLTGNPIYNEKASKVCPGDGCCDGDGDGDGDGDQVWDVLRSGATSQRAGLYPNSVNLVTGSFVGGAVSMGALSDSFYEYLLKYYILSGGHRTDVLQMYIQSVDAILDVLLVEFKDDNGKPLHTHTHTHTHTF